jgi:hypothetical protein|tara:strand:+ start:5285 stop:5926 length:642 start_codon:yes stop_codon:yes gene_type:complete
MIFNTDRKFMHISIPRTGSTQLNILLQHTKHPEPDDHHMMLNRAITLHPEAAKDDYFKFTFVRNPLDRMVSLYSEFRKNRQRQYSGQVIMDNPLFSEFDKGNEIDSFRNFCCNFQYTDWVNNIFLRPQSEYILSDNCKMNFIGRFEKLHDDWYIISERVLGRKISLVDRQKETHPEAKPRSSNHDYYMNYYDSESLDAVRSFYKEDFDRFNYE